MGNILEYFLFGAGIYYIVMVQKMKMTGKIPSTLISNKVNLERSKDVPGYMKYIYPRGMIFGILICVFSLIIIMNHYVTIYPLIVLLAEVGFIALIIWYSIISVKAQNKFLF